MDDIYRTKRAQLDASPLFSMHKAIGTRGCGSECSTCASVGHGCLLAVIAVVKAKAGPEHTAAPMLAKCCKTTTSTSEIVEQAVQHGSSI